MSIHSRIKERRMARKMSRSELAEAVGVSWQSVQLWETEGKTAPKRARPSAVAKALDCTEEYLVTGKETEQTIDVVQQKWLGLLKDLSGLDIEEFLELITKRQERNRRLLADLKDNGRSARNTVLSIDDTQISPEEMQIIKALRNAKPEVKEAINVELKQADLKN